MQRRSSMLGSLCLVVASLATSAAALGDTIVLKNGKRIVALSVVEEGDKVRYETSAGTLTLPKSIVDHIEKGGAGFAGDTGSSRSGQLALTPPAAESGGTEIERNAVHDGSVDRTYIAKLEGEARSGSWESNMNAALALHAAALFELSHGDIERGLGDERSALIYAPGQVSVLLNIAYVHLRRSEFKQSLEYLDRARRIAPDNADVAKLSGWAYYGLNKLDEAVAQWKHAMALRADPDVKAALEKAERDKQEEASYKENESTHFNLRYSGAAEPALARDVLRTLEGHYNAVESELSFSTPDSIGVILYTQQAFADITRAPAWVGAVNDGRIRVPVQGLSSVTPELSRVLKHELTHSFVKQKTGGRAPTWLQEGLAQWMEGKRSGPVAEILLQNYQSKRVEPLSNLEANWMRLDPEAVGYAYSWALATVEYVVQTDGMQDVDRILDRIAAGEGTEAALRNVLHDSYADLLDSTAEYLRKTYR